MEMFSISCDGSWVLGSPSHVNGTGFLVLHLMLMELGSWFSISCDGNWVLGSSSLVMRTGFLVLHLM